MVAMRLTALAENVGPTITSAEAVNALSQAAAVTPCSTVRTATTSLIATANPTNSVAKATASALRNVRGAMANINARTHLTNETVVRCVHLDVSSAIQALVSSAQTNVTIYANAMAAKMRRVVKRVPTHATARA